MIAIDQTTLMAFSYVHCPRFCSPSFRISSSSPSTFSLFFSIGPRLLTRAFIAGQGSSLMKDTSLSVPDLTRNPYFSSPNLNHRSSSAKSRRRSPIVDLSQLNFVTRRAASDRRRRSPPSVADQVSFEEARLIAPFEARRASILAESFPVFAIKRARNKLYIDFSYIKCSFHPPSPPPPPSITDEESALLLEATIPLFIFRILFPLAEASMGALRTLGIRQTTLSSLCSRVSVPGAFSCETK